MQVLSMISHPTPNEKLGLSVRTSHCLSHCLWPSFSINDQSFNIERKAWRVCPDIPLPVAFILSQLTIADILPSSLHIPLGLELTPIMSPRLARVLARSLPSIS